MGFSACQHHRSDWEHRESAIVRTSKALPLASGGCCEAKVTQYEGCHRVSYSKAIRNSSRQNSIRRIRNI